MLPRVTFAVRQLRARKWATVFSCLAIALSLGSIGGAYSLLSAVVFRTMSVNEPSRLVVVAPMMGEATLGIPGATLAQLPDALTSVESVCGISRGAAVVELHGELARRGIEAVDGGCYRLLGVRPALGRLIDTSDAPQVGVSSPVAVLTHRYWRSSFNSDPDVIGSFLKVETMNLAVIGVLPESFAGIYADQGPDFVVPLGLVGPLLGVGNRVTALYALGRLKPGISLELARNELRTVWPSVWSATNPVPAGRPPAASNANSLIVESGARGISDLRKQYATALYLLIALAVVLALMAWVNVATLFTSAAIQRSGQFRIVTSLGEGQLGIAAILIMEAAFIGAVGGLAAAVVASAVTRFIAGIVWVGFLPMTMAVDPPPVLLLAIAVASVLVACTLALPGIAVTLRTNRSTGVMLTRATNVSTRVGRSVLVVSQAALTLALVFLASLLTANVARLQAIDPGYSATELSFSRLERVPTTDGSWDRRSYVAALLEGLGRVNGVRGAALANAFPTTELKHLGSLPQMSVMGEERGVSAGEYRVTPGFFATLQVALLGGRDFTFDDDVQHPPVGVANRALVRRLFADESNVIGAVLEIGPAKRKVTIVGVVGDFSPGDVRISDLPVLYSPYLQAPQQLVTPMLVVRAGNPALPSIGQTVGALGRHYVTAFRPVSDHLSSLMARERIMFGLSLTFAALGVLIGATGLYAALAYDVSRRRREVALRVALGARRTEVVNQVVSGVMIMVCGGAVVGIPLALGAARLGRDLLFGISANDPILLGGSLVLLLVVAVIASAVPVSQALRIQPSVALKEL